MKRIPITAAKRFAEAHDLRQVVIVCLNAEDDTAHVVTYGKSLEDCRLAAESGNNLKKHMGWPDKLSSAVPARLKRKLSLIAALSLLATPALAQQTTSDAAAKASALAVSGGGTTIFEASRSRNNTPDAFGARGTEGTTECMYPGLSGGGSIAGFGASLGIPLGTDHDCKHERMARFRMQTAELLMKAGKEAEAQRNIVAANESLCRISYNLGTAMCAPAPAPQPVTVYYYCRNPAGYYPAVQGCPRWETVPR